VLHIAAERKRIGNGPDYNSKASVDDTSAAALIDVKSRDNIGKNPNTLMGDLLGFVWLMPSTIGGT
jgi:hypothetical protein